MTMFETCYNQIKEVEKRMEVLNNRGLNDEAEELYCEMVSTIQSLDDYINFIALFDSYKWYRDNDAVMMCFDMLSYNIEEWGKIIESLIGAGVKHFSIPKDDLWYEYAEHFGSEEMLIRVIRGGLKINYLGIITIDTEYGEDMDVSVFSLNPRSLMY